MREWTMSCLILSLCVGISTAAPGLKEPDEPPPTAAQAKTTINNLKQLGLAVHNYHDTNNAFPANIMKDGKPILSWRVLLLPYMDEIVLYREFKLDEPWDGPNNKKLVEKMPKLFKPVRGKAAANETFYQMFNWKTGLLRPDGTKTNFANVVDGLSNTLLIVEAYSPVIWSKPDDIAYDPKELPKLGRMFNGDTHSVMCDGSVLILKKSADPELLRRLIDPRDGLTIDRNKLDRPSTSEPKGAVPPPPPRPKVAVPPPPPPPAKP